MQENKSRASYFKERRKNTKTFYVEIEKSLMDKLENYLSRNKITKKEWLTKLIEKLK